MPAFKTPIPKPCPYCGGLPRIRFVGDFKQFFILRCDNCPSPLNSGDAKSTFRQAVKIWNKRCKERSESE